MFMKFTDFVFEIKPLSLLKKQASIHAIDSFQKSVVQSFVFKTWQRNSVYDPTSKTFLAKSFSLKKFELSASTATAPYHFVKQWKFQKPLRVFTQKGAIRSDRCRPEFLLSELWDKIDTIQCQTMQSPNFKTSLKIFYDFLASDEIAGANYINQLWDLRKSDFKTLFACLKELEMFDGKSSPAPRQSIEAINFIIRGHEDCLQNFQNALTVAEVTQCRYNQEDQKLAKSEEQIFLPLDKEDGLNRLERSALIYKLKISLNYLFSAKLLREFSDYKNRDEAFFHRLNLYLEQVRHHLAALAFVQSLKRNSERDKNKRQGARYKKPKIDNFLLLSIERATGNFKTAMQVLYLTGLRPIELEKGVKISATEDKICFEVKGAKIRQKRGASSGQEWRRFAIPRRELPSDFGNWQRLSSGTSGIFSFKRANLWKLFRLLKQQNPEFRNLRPYSFRHGFASALKLAGFSTELIAQAMGHQSTRTQRKYGSAKERKSGTFVHPAQALEDVDAAAKVRVYESSLDFAALNEAGVDAETTAENGKTSDVRDGANEKAGEAPKNAEATKPNPSDFDPDPFGF